MRSLQGQEVVVAGAGALGLVAALRIAEAGAAVTLCDPAGLGDNASGVAAGMLAPAFESALDPEGGDHFALLAAARDLWPALAARIGLEIDRSGAMLVGAAVDAAALSETQARLRTLGLEPERLARATLARARPGLAEPIVEGLFTPEDWRLSPPAALTALAAAGRAAGVRIVPAPLRAAPGGFTLDGHRVTATVVIAAGSETSLGDAAPELAHLSPIKGQILRFESEPLDGAVVRGVGGYIAPQPGGALAGATMEAGRRDRAVEAATLMRLRAEAARLFPHLASAPAQGRAGVRAATPDGLPLVGRSRGGTETPVILCAGARRNGWLLAPMVAEAVLAAMQGDAPAAAFDPTRFG